MSARLLPGSAWHVPALARRPAVVRHSVADAWRRLLTRRMLVDLDDRMLKDIGASWGDARVEAAKPFWKA